jgi:hypothetical protein
MRYLIPASLALLLTATLSAQDPHLKHRGAAAMGFDQDKTAHHFLLFDDGGAIDVSVKDASDTTNRDAIRAHLPHIAEMFGAGNFEAPMFVHDTRTVPGVAALAAMKSSLKYTYSETPGGGRVDIVSTNAEAVKAVHQFLRFQITDHKTGDPLTPRKR